MTQYVKVLHYKEYKIKLNTAMRFVISGDGFDEHEGAFASYDSAKAAIDSYLKAAAKSKKLALEIMDADGKEYVITGINMHTGNFTTKPVTHEEDSYSMEDDGIESIESNAYYPRVEKIKPLIAEVKRLFKELKKKQETLERLRINYGRGRADVSTIGEEMDKLIKDYESAKEAAKKLP